MKKSIILILFLSLTLFSIKMAYSQESFQWINESKCKQHVFLTRNVTVKSSLLALGDLLEKLSEKTGVDLKISNELELSGTSISIYANDEPLWKVMNGLVSLLSYKNAPWKWKESIINGRIEFILFPTPMYLKLKESLILAAQNEFMDHTNRIFRFARQTPIERRNNKNELVGALLGDERLADAYLQNLSGIDETWDLFAIADELLTESSKIKLLNGEKITIDGSQVSSKQLQSLLKSVPASNSTSIKSVSYFLTSEMSSSKVPVYILMQQIDQDANLYDASLTGLLILPQTVAKIQKDWILSGDALSDKDFEATKYYAKDSIRFSNSNLESKMENVDDFSDYVSSFCKKKERMSLSALHELPSGVGTEHQPYGSFDWKRTLAEERGGMIYKYREGCVLVTYPNRFFGDEALFPYETLKKLRILLEKSNGKPRLKQLFGIISSLSFEASRRISLLEPTFKRVLNLPIKPYLYTKCPALFEVNGVIVDSSNYALIATNLGKRMPNIGESIRIVGISLDGKGRQCMGWEILKGAFWKPLLTFGSYALPEGIQLKPGQPLPSATKP